MNNISGRGIPRCKKMPKAHVFVNSPSGIIDVFPGATLFSDGTGAAALVNDGLIRVANTPGLQSYEITCALSGSGVFKIEGDGSVFEFPEEVSGALTFRMAAGAGFRFWRVTAGLVVFEDASGTLALVTRNHPARLTIKGFRKGCTINLGNEGFQDFKYEPGREPDRGLLVIGKPGEVLATLELLGDYSPRNFFIDGFRFLTTNETGRERWPT